VASSRQRGMFPANFVEPVMAQSAVMRSEPSKGGSPQEAKPAASKEEVITRIPLTLFAHNLAICGAWLNIVFGLLSVLWDFQRLNPQDTPDKLQELFVVTDIWIYTFAVTPFIFIFEWFYGLKRPLSGSKFFSPRGISYILLSVPMYIGYVTMINGGVITCCGLAHMMADYNRECGIHVTAKGERFLKMPGKSVFSKWGLFYLFANIVVTVEASFVFFNLVHQLEAPCAGITNFCITNWAIVAKVSGSLLDFNCAIVLVPVMKSTLRWANNIQVGRKGKMLNQYIPLKKNLFFHKYIAFFIFVNTFIHIASHYINFAFSPEVTLFLFGENPWFTGAFLTLFMVLMYCGAQNRVKRASYEVFYLSHHFYVPFFFLLIAHGPNFFAYSAVPVILYLFDRIYRAQNGYQKFQLRRVLYVPPIMELSFFPEKSWSFKEGQYLYLNAPHLSANEWHPFTISSAAGDLENAERKEITLHIKVQGFKSWTRNLMEYFSTMASNSNKKGDAFVVDFSHFNERGQREAGKYLGPDGKPLIAIDGPHAAPAQAYSGYNEVMLIGAGIGLTPTSSILKAICRYKWKKGFSPEVVYFYWIVRHDEIESFRWFVNVLYELEKRVASDRRAGALSPDHRIELNVYVTAAPKAGSAQVVPKTSDLKFSSAQDMNVGYNVDVGFTEEMLLRALLNPSAPSEQQRTIQAQENRDIWVWNGRPQWADIFQSVKEKRGKNTTSVATCFCGTPVIGKDLKVNCSRASSSREKIRFDLYKENF